MLPLSLASMRGVGLLARHTCWAPWLRWNVCAVVFFHLLCRRGFDIADHAGSYTIVLSFIPVVCIVVCIDGKKLPLVLIFIIILIDI